MMCGVPHSGKKVGRWYKGITTSSIVVHEKSGCGGRASRVVMVTVGSHHRRDGMVLITPHLGRR